MNDQPNIETQRKEAVEQLRVLIEQVQSGRCTTLVCSGFTDKKDGVAGYEFGDAETILRFYEASIQYYKKMLSQHKEELEKTSPVEAGTINQRESSAESVLNERAKLNT